MLVEVIFHISNRQLSERKSRISSTPRYQHHILQSSGCPLDYTPTPPEGCAGALVYRIGFESRYGQDERVAFVDYSLRLGGQDCETHHVDNVNS